MKDKIFNVNTIIELFDKPIFKKNLQLFNDFGYNPKICCILTSNDEGCLSYIKGIENICNQYSIGFEQCESSNAEGLEKIIKDKNNDDSVTGIIVMYPTPYKSYNDTYFMNLVDVNKDVEGLNNVNLGYMIQYEMFADEYNLRKNVIPPTAKGILYLMKRYYRLYEKQKNNFGKYPDDIQENPFKIEGASITIINDSLSVGRSLALMFLNENASIRVCQKYTDKKDIMKFISVSDIVVSAVPDKNFIIPSQIIKEGSIIFDVSFEGNFEYPKIFDKVYKIAPKWDLTNKGNRINDMTLNRLLSNLFYLANYKLPDDALYELKDFENSIIPDKKVEGLLKRDML